MGGAPKKIVKSVSKVGKGVVKVGGEVFEETIEKPGKKVIREAVDTITGMDKYDRIDTPEVMPEVTPEIVEDESPTITTRYATRGKRSGQGGTIMEGYGVTTRPPSKRSIST
ncbi:MAG TPA: hypothetical protein DEO86_17160 [Colwellia sp.]|nr:hypothetical protein [Colwellia sp.]|tara:strand:- start:1144 stop:1479 length:336 start_codon:yes stop_codon:yes gene_type:complete